MKTNNYIAIEQLCEYYDVPVTFINTLNDFNFIEIATIEKINYVKKNQIGTIEKIMRLHFDLDINMEGIDAIQNLLKKVESLNFDILELRNRLNRYEDFKT